MAGLRLMVMSVNENRVLCSLQTNKVTGCDEMATVRRGLDDIYRLQRYVDAQAGGPGKGFFQIVTDPFAARRVINQGRMAVVLEIEVSEPFGCRGWFTPSCDRAKVDKELDDLYQRGVRSALLLNKFDNPLTGVRFHASYCPRQRWPRRASDGADSGSASPSDPRSASSKSCSARPSRYGFGSSSKRRAMRLSASSSSGPPSPSISVRVRATSSRS